MDFSDLLSKGWELAQKGKEKLQEKYDHINEIKNHLEGYEDEKLYRIFRTSSGDMKIAAGLLLKERGYGNNQE